MCPARVQRIYIDFLPFNNSNAIKADGSDGNSKLVYVMNDVLSSTVCDHIST